MALATVIRPATAQTLLDTLTTLLNGGTVEFYDGTKPTDPSVAISTQNLLATVTLNATAFAASTAGGSAAQAVLNTIASSVISASGTPTWARMKRSSGNGSTAILDVTVGSASTNIVCTPATFTAGGSLTLTYTASLPYAGN